MENIVQAEFFHVGGAGTRSLEHLSEQAMERVRDNLPLALAGGSRPIGSGIKTCVRFYDRGGALTALAREYKLLSERSDETLRSFGTTSLKIWRVWLEHKRRSLTSKKKNVRRGLELRAIEVLTQTLAERAPVALEIWDRSYRPLQPEEYHELLESVRSAKRLWAFVFAPNEDLCSDTNTIVASMMSL